MATTAITGYLSRLGNLLLGESVAKGLQRNILSGYAQTALSIVLTLVSYPLYLSALGTEAFSIWIIVSSVINMNNIGTCGLSTALLKRTADLSPQTDADEILKVFSHTTAMTLLLALLFMIAVYAASQPILGFLGITEAQTQLATWWLVWICILIPISFLTDQVQSLVAGLGRYDLANASQAGQQSIVIVVAALGFVLGEPYYAMPIAMGLSFIIQSILLVRIARSILPIFPRWVSPTDWSLHRSLLGLGGQAAGGAVAEMCFHMLNRLLVAKYIGLVQVPVYEIAFNSSVRLRGVLASGFKSLLPEAAKLSASSQSEKVTAIVKSLTGRVAVFGLAIWLATYIVGEWALRLWLGDEVGIPAYTAFLVLSVGALLNACAIPTFFALLGFGHFRLMIETTVVQSVVNVAVFFAMLGSGFDRINPAVAAASVAFVASALWIAIAGLRFGMFTSRRMKEVPSC